LEKLRLLRFRGLGEDAIEMLMDQGIAGARRIGFWNDQFRYRGYGLQLMIVEELRMPLGGGQRLGLRGLEFGSGERNDGQT
jgi:hypothetical protein